MGSNKTDLFVEKAKNIHGDRYDYSLTEYVDSKTKVKIICSEHGEFLQNPGNHLNNHGCQKCGKSYKYTTDEWVEMVSKCHNNKYDYSLVNYINVKTKVKIICPIHGEFEQTPHDHLRGSNCPKCSNVYSPTNDEWIEQARNIHGDKYIYDKVEYIKTHNKVIITCPIHGDFEQDAASHLQGRGCPKCGYESSSICQQMSTSEFIERSIKLHGDTYDYSFVKYTGIFNPVKIICKEHGMFEQQPVVHLRGGCSKCLLKGQTLLFQKLKAEFPSQIIEWEYSPEWLGRQRFDICFLELNLAIEYNGRQHYESVDFFGGEEGFAKIIERDLRKRDKCKENDWIIIDIKYNYNQFSYDDLVNSINNIIEEKYA